MLSIIQGARGMWLPVAVAGGAALAVALVAAFWTGSPTLPVGAWALVVAAAIFAAAWRAPAGFGSALPYLGAAIAGLVLGVALLALPSRESRTAVIAIGILGIVPAAGHLSVARVARAIGLPDGGLYEIGWIGLAAGMATVALPVFGFGVTALTGSAALAITGAITLLAAVRLRMLPLELPAPLSRRELERRARAGRRR